MTIPTKEKDSDAVVDFRVDWRRWLKGGDTITASTWSVASGIVKGADSHTGTSTTAWFSGGTVGTGYLVTNRITTTEGRIDERSFTIQVIDR